MYFRQLTPTSQAIYCNEAYCYKYASQYVKHLPDQPASVLFTTPAACLRCLWCGKITSINPDCWLRTSEYPKYCCTHDWSLSKQYVLLVQYIYKKYGVILYDLPQKSQNIIIRDLRTPGHRPFH